MANPKPLTGHEYSVLKMIHRTILFNNVVNDISGGKDEDATQIDRATILWAQYYAPLGLKENEIAQVSKTAKELEAKGLIQQPTNAVTITESGVSAISETETDVSRGLLRDILINLSYEFTSPNVPILADTTAHNLDLELTVFPFLIKGLENHKPRLAKMDYRHEENDQGVVYVHSDLYLGKNVFPIKVCLTHDGKKFADKLMTHEGRIRTVWGWIKEAVTDWSKEKVQAVVKWGLGVLVAGVIAWWGLHNNSPKAPANSTENPASSPATIPTTHP